MTAGGTGVGTIGVIADTHGLWRPEVAHALAGSDLIVHAGDVGDPGILEELRTIAPVVAVRGNVDRGSWSELLPVTEFVDIGDTALYVVHIIDELDLDPARAGIRAVVYGHSHRPSAAWKDHVLFFNPGSAGPRRFTLPVTVGRLHVTADEIVPEHVHLTSTPVHP